MPRKIYYVGLKSRESGGETAFMSETNIRWFPGDSYHVPDAIAGRMLAHPDVFSDKSPEERAVLAEEERQRAAQEQADLQQQEAGNSLQTLLAALPPGSNIVLPNGVKIEVPKDGLKADLGAATQVRGLEGAHASPMAARLAGATGADNESGAPTTPLNAAVDGIATENVQETQVGNAGAEISLAPGATVATDENAIATPARRTRAAAVRG